jgi:hypothetical protein
MKKRGLEGLVLAFIVISIVVAFFMAFLANESIGVAMIGFLPSIISLVIILLVMEPLRLKDKTAVIIIIPIIVCALFYTIQSEFTLIKNMEPVILVFNFIIALAATILIYYLDKNELLVKSGLSKEDDELDFGISADEFAVKNAPKEIKQTNKEIQSLRRKLKALQNQKELDKNVVGAFRKIQGENLHLQQKFRGLQNELSRAQIDAKYKAIEDLKEIAKDSSNFGIKTTINEVSRESKELRRDVDKFKGMLGKLHKY